MKILIHNDIYSDFKLFSEVCDFIFKGDKIENVHFLCDLEEMRFDVSYQQQKTYNRNNYTELEASLLDEYIVNNPVLFKGLEGLRELK